MQRFADERNSTCVRLLRSSVPGIALGFILSFPEGTSEGEDVVVESYPAILQLMQFYEEGVGPVRWVSSFAA